MLDEKQLVMIKGTRDGLTFIIDDSCSFEDAYMELKEKLAASRPQKDEPNVPVAVKLGNRYLHEQQREKLIDLIGKENHFTVQTLDSNLIHKDEALHLWKQSDIQAINRIVRSGQVLEVEGDLLLIGDVNPGGKVVSSGNIYVMGSLQGIAHAGAEGDRDAFIAASYMKPSQLRIADYISRAPDYEAEGVYMECGYIDEMEDKIMIDRLHVLTRKRRRISGFERRIKNG